MVVLNIRISFKGEKGMIEMKNVSKKIKKNLVLDQITYTFEYGNVYGLYGIRNPACLACICSFGAKITHLATLMNGMAC